MENRETTANVETISTQLETLLRNKGFCFSRLHTKKNSCDIFNIVCDTEEEGLLEQWIAVYVYNEVLFFESSLPVTYSDDAVVAGLINDLNLNNPIGTYQLDVEDGELNWTNYLPIRNGVWPGNSVVLSVLENAKHMSEMLYHRLLSLDNRLASTD